MIEALLGALIGAFARPAWQWCSKRIADRRARKVDLLELRAVELRERSRGISPFPVWDAEQEAFVPGRAHWDSGNCTVACENGDHSHGWVV